MREVFRLKTQDSGFIPEWENIKKRHMDDPCASRVIQYAECWVSVMNTQLGNGNRKKFAEIAEESLQIAGNMSSYELSPFQYGCMVTLLHKYWKYGENLRKWHNLRVGGEVGRRANTEGWVINPGLTI